MPLRRSEAWVRTPLTGDCQPGFTLVHRPLPWFGGRFPLGSKKEGTRGKGNEGKEVESRGMGEVITEGRERGKKRNFLCLFPHHINLHCSQPITWVYRRWTGGHFPYCLKLRGCPVFCSPYCPLLFCGVNIFVPMVSLFSRKLLKLLPPAVIFQG